MQHINFDNNITREDMDYIAKARGLFEKCYYTETEIPLDSDLDYLLLSRLTKDWAESPMDKLYRLGQVYLEMYFIKKVFDKDNVKTDLYGQQAERYLNTARAVGNELKRTGISGRNTWFISEKLAWYYIFSENYDKAIKLIERSRDSFIKNTYAIALLLSKVPDRFQKAEEALTTAASDNYNKAKDISVALLAHLYKLSDREEKLRNLLLDKKESLSNSSKKLVCLLENGEDNHYEGR